jgi:Mg/Co/Ni transporter MgtE
MNLIPVLDEKNSYVGYYEIDDIMSFSPDSILERTRKNNKGKKEYWIIQ